MNVRPSIARWKPVLLVGSCVWLAPSGVGGVEQDRLYEITAGTFTVVGGIWGAMSTGLPYYDCTMVALTTDTETHSASMEFLGSGFEPSSLFGLVGVNPSFANGRMAGNLIEFEEEVTAEWPERVGVLMYAVVLGDDFLDLNGSVDLPYMCCDIPYHCSHEDVHAWLVPDGFGDANADQRLDRSDLQDIVGCVQGPDRDADAACVFADRDGDARVDLSDVAAVQRLWRP